MIFSHFQEFGLFLRIWDQEGMKLLPTFWLFSRIWDQKEWSNSSIFGYFHEFESRDELPYLLVSGYFYELRPERNKRISQFFAMFTILRAEKK